MAIDFCLPLAYDTITIVLQYVTECDKYECSIFGSTWGPVSKYPGFFLHKMAPKKATKVKDPSCKFCKRKKSVVSWRGLDGLQCRSCPRVLLSLEEYKDRDKQELSEELDEGTIEHTTYLQKVEQWEADNPFNRRAAAWL
jgi:hypothetical protein